MHGEAPCIEHRSIAMWDRPLPCAGAEEDMLVAVFARQGGEDLQRAIAERHAMLAARLRALAGIVQSFAAKSISDHVAPDDLARARRRQDGEFQRPRRHAVRCPQPRHESGTAA